MQGKYNSSRLPAGKNSGLTLLELLIILAVVAGIIFIALPTLKPSQEEETILFAKEQLKYLASKEEQYFLRNGTYAPLSVVAADEEVGRDYDMRFAEDTSIVNGVEFKGPEREARIFDIQAKLPNGVQYIVDQTGVVKAMQ